MQTIKVSTRKRTAELVDVFADNGIDDKVLLGTIRYRGELNWPWCATTMEPWGEQRTTMNAATKWQAALYMAKRHGKRHFSGDVVYVYGTHSLVGTPELSEV